jgi:hypothetical protein
MTGSKGDDFEMMGKFFQEFDGVGADVDTCFNNLAGDKFDVEFYVTRKT